MKYPTLHKVMLTTMALVASLALSAQAGSPNLSTAEQNIKAAAITLQCQLAPRTITCYRSPFTS